VPRITVDVVSSDEERDLAMGIWRAANVTRRRPAGDVRAGRVRDKLDSAELLLLAHYGPRPAGVLLAETFVDGRPDPETGHISMLFVDPAVWGSGVGHRLLRDLQQRQWPRLSAWMHEDNRRALRLFEGADFTDTGNRAHLQDGDVICQYLWSR
jgi:ribosomal protein S18 acetylase RimI-like enzyme